ncbi:MAG: YigZ family protein [Balneolales bacterium]
MNTIINPVSITFTERGSRFLGYVYHVATIDNIEEKLGSLKKQYPDATHHCYAYRFNPENLHEFAHDDGEPGGTAGLPILNVLKSHELINVMAVAVRYYGGTKLGKPGLIHAYRTTVEQCIESAAIGKLFLTQRIRLTYPYSEQKCVDQITHNYGLTVTNRQYMEEVEITLECDIKLAAKLKDELTAHAHMGFKTEDLEKFYGLKMI